MSAIEKIGFGIILIGFVLMILDRVVTDEAILSISKNHVIIYWLGLAIWALGFLQRRKNEQTGKS